MLTMYPEISRGFETRMRIVNAVSVLAENDDFKKMTVQEICDVAEVSRPTFYRHFTDKYSVVEWYTLLGYADSVFLMGRKYTMHESFVRMLRFVVERETLFRCALKSRDDYNSLPNYAERITYEVWSKTLTDNGIEPKPQLELQLRIFCKIGIEIVMLFLTKYREKLTIDEWSHIVEAFIPKELQSVMNEPVLKARSEKLSSLW